MSDYSLVEKIKSLQGKFESLSAQISDPELMQDMKRYVQLNKGYKELAPIIETGKVYCKMVQDLDGAKEILQNEKDEDLREMAKEEVKMVLRSSARWGSPRGSGWSSPKSFPTATPSWHKTPKWRVPAIRFSTNRPQKGLQRGANEKARQFRPAFPAIPSR